MNRPERLEFKRDFMAYRWALVDIETTGLHVTHDAITEIAVYILTELGIVASWHRLIKPTHTIPQAICTLTGITNEMVHDAPSFTAIATELYEVLEDCVNEHSLKQWRKLPELKSNHTYDAYKILLSYLKHKADKDTIIELD